jgi:hypothetical protein
MKRIKLNKAQLAGIIPILIIWILMSYKALFPFAYELERMRSVIGIDNHYLLRLIRFLGFTSLPIGIMFLWTYIWSNKLTYNSLVKIIISFISIGLFVKIFSVLGKIIISVL